MYDQQRPQTTWWLVSVLTTLLLALAGGILHTFHVQALQVQALVSAHTERIVALETDVRETKANLQRIEGRLSQMDHKLDRLLGRLP